MYEKECEACGKLFTTPTAYWEHVCVPSTPPAPSAERLLLEELRNWKLLDGSTNTHIWRKKWLPKINTILQSAPSEPRAEQKVVLICPVCKRQAEVGDYVGIVGCSKCNPVKNYTSNLSPAPQPSLRERIEALLDDYISEHRNCGQCDAEPCDKCLKARELLAELKKEQGGS